LARWAVVFSVLAFPRSALSFFIPGTVDVTLEVNLPVACDPR
jgi:hypothetical protein